ncbi:prolinerich protein PRCC [Striga asiatica]|uniref:Prolinerich protein PRCC n=1 Tax=Striga asiatica TaxID=4170 RepID=A0A5A7RJJ7_STRAF|nr:prolinerich protein PRCC [Striga asiatica]
MDSLLANYASSDDDDQPSPRVLSEKPVRSESIAGVARDEENSPPKSTPTRGGIFNSLPPPKSSLFNSLPPPKSKPFTNPKPQIESEHQREVNGRDEQNAGNSNPKPSSASLFSSLPRPKSSSSSSSSSTAKRVVQFRPPTIVNPRTDEDDDSDEDEHESQRKKAKETISTASATSFLSSIPAPKHSATLGSLPSALGRRSMLETDTRASIATTGSDSVVGPVKPSEVSHGYSGLNSESAYSDENAADGNFDLAPESGINMGIDVGMNHINTVNDYFSSSGGESSAYYGYYGIGPSENEGSDGVPDYPYGNGDYAAYAGGYGDYDNNAQYGNNWNNITGLPEPEVSGAVEPSFPIPGKRGRKDVPPQIIEVKQDELIKNRPREDQVKMTGVAFGPAYQPASTKGKPTKLHKRKHQIGSLYFDMRQKEMELAERRAKGFLTKAQTQAKYGW